MSKKTHFPDLNGAIRVMPESERSAWRPSAYTLVQHNEEILTVRPRWSSVFDLTGGGLDLGETIQEAAERETEEESGLRVRLLDPMPFHIHQGNVFYQETDGPDPIDCYRHVLGFFFHAVLVSDKVNEEILKKHETAEVRWTPIRHIEDWLAGGRDLNIRSFYREPLLEGLARPQAGRGGWKG